MINDELSSVRTKGSISKKLILIIMLIISMSTLSNKSCLIAAKLNPRFHPPPFFFIN